MGLWVHAIDVSDPFIRDWPVRIMRGISVSTGVADCRQAGGMPTVCVADAGNFGTMALTPTANSPAEMGRSNWSRTCEVPMGITMH